jgi:hypothetical protein
MNYSTRVLAAMAVPAGGASVSASNSGGGPTVVTVPEGDYFLTDDGGLDSLLDTLEAQLNATRDPAPGSWSVSLSTTTGLVTIDCSSGVTLTRTGGGGVAWDAGIASVETFAGDGYVQVTADETNKRKMFGLSTNDPDVNFNTIDYACYLTNGAAVEVYENGVQKYSGGSYTTDDVFRVERVGATIFYKKNGTTFYTSLIASVGALLVDTSFFDLSATLKCLRLYDNGTQETLTWQNNTSITVSATTWSIAWTNTTLRDVLGFAADIAAVATPQTGTKHARSVWFPDCPMFIADSDPRLAPVGHDGRTSVSGSGARATFVGVYHRIHRAVSWPSVPLERIREQSAPYANASFRTFWDDTQLARGPVSWFRPGSSLCIVDYNGAVLGEDMQAGGPTEGWGVTDVDVEPKRNDPKGWVGLWTVTIPELIAKDE